MIIVRQIEINDAEALVDFTNKLDAESKYLLYDPGERKNDLDKIKAYLSRIITENTSIIFIAQNDVKKIVGFVCGEVSYLNRVSHVMHANIGVLKNYHRAGIGTLLCKKLLTHAKRTGIERVEATVINHNHESLKLCKKLGFKIEGIKRCSIKIGDKFHDEYLLSMMMSSYLHDMK